MKKSIILVVIAIIVAAIIVAAIAVYISNSQSTSVASSSSQSSACSVSSVNDLSITNELLGTTKNADGTVTIQYKYTIQNLTDYTVYDVRATSHFNHSTPGLFTIVSLTGGDGLTLNPAYNGMSDVNLLTGANTLAPHAVKYIFLTIRLHYSADIQPFINYVDISGKTSCAGSSSSRTSSSSSISSSSTTSRPSSSTSSSSSSKTSSTTSSSGTSSASSRPSSTRSATSSLPVFPAPDPGTSTSRSSSSVTSSATASANPVNLYDSDQVTFDFPIEEIPTGIGNAGKT